MSSDSDILTSNRIKAKWRAFLAEFAGIYEKCPAPKPTFWPLYEKEEAELVLKLCRRPLPLIDIETMFSVFRSKLLKAL
jgi:hypothetical protein